MVRTEGVTDANKDSVCQVIADDLRGAVIYCSLEGPSTARRRLQQQNLYMNLLVNDREASVILIESDDFISLLSNLSNGTTIMEISLHSGIGKYFMRLKYL